jgi:hypothetical protein
VATKKPSVRVNLTEVKVLQESLRKMASTKYHIQVGVFGAKTMRKEANGLTNAEIGFTHEMGSAERHIPRRSFLWDTFAHHGEKLMAALKPAAKQFFAKGKIDEYLKLCGTESIKLVQEAFFTSGWGAWPPLAYATLLQKLRGPLWKRRQLAAEVLYEGAQHDKALIRSGQLWQAIDARVAHG